jgi:hypothetical protein
MILLAGCVPHVPGNNDSQATPAPLFREIDETEFENAVSSLAFTEDEFDGTQTLGIKNKKNVFTKSGKKAGALIADIFKMTSDEKWTVNLMSLYVAPDYIFHDSIAVKSQEDSKSIFIDTTQRSDDYLSYNRISESAGNLISDEDFAGFCTVIEQTDVVFRLAGSDGTYKAKMNATALKVNRNVCISYFGLLQGLELKR